MKQERLLQMINLYRSEAEKLNKNEIGKVHLILIEGVSKTVYILLKVIQGSFEQIT